MLLSEPAEDALVLLPFDLGKAMQQFLLFLVQLFWDFDIYSYELVSPSILGNGHAAALKPKDRAALCSLRDDHTSGSIQCRNFYLVSQCCLGKRDGPID